MAAVAKGAGSVRDRPGADAGARDLGGRLGAGSEATGAA